MELEHIFGLTTGNNTALAAHPTQDIIAYLAGSVVVLYDHRRNKQIGFLTANSPYTPLSSSDATVGLSPSNGTGGNGMSVSANAVSYSSIGYGSSSGNSSSLNGSNTAGNPNLASTRMAMKKHAHAPLKTLICLAISADGNYLAAGEIGHRPRILIWDLKTYNLVAQLRGHRFGVLSISFSPNNKFLVSCGLQHDGFLYIWQWRQGIKLTSNKIVNKTQSIVFSKNGSFCVTSGQRFVKYWYLDTNGNLPSCKTSTKDSQSPRTVRILQGRSGILADLCNNTFLDAACGTGPNGAEYTYLVASTGLLCLFVKDRVLDRWVDLQVRRRRINKKYRLYL
ncbi:WD40-repeat-containing domain protein [Syncephalis fuscata]|nr:WD40-repeat-containing domain protein [Syncephalis fuscata]